MSIVSSHVSALRLDSNAMYRTKSDVPAATRNQVVTLFNQQLADCIDLWSQCRQAHWNVKGTQFIALHEMSGEISESVEGYIDLIAERVE